ncbi:MAG: hypothetical protein JSW64_12425, partial [Candidatus Zixiibacteriota bacterium]
MRYLPSVLLILFICFGDSLSHASERDPGYPDLPIPSYSYPDTNFTLMSHGFPTSPREQLLANGHLYVAMGAYIVIYEVLPNGRLEETCSKMTDHVIASMAHDGNYLYLSGNKGLQIYEGTNYANPQPIGFNPMRYSQILDGISVFGDSLYYSWKENRSEDYWFGIMDVHDRSNPQVAIEFENEIWTSPEYRPICHNRYLILLTRITSSHSFFGVYDLDSPPGTLFIIDSLQANFGKMKLYEDRLYSIRTNSFMIYEFTGSTQPEFRGAIYYYHHIEDMSEMVISGDRYAFVTTWNAHVYKINVNDLSNPLVVDSIIVPENLNHEFRDIEQHGDYSYAMTSRLNDYVRHPGVHVIDWNLPGGPEMVQSVKKYSHCNGVRVINDVAYTVTDNDNVMVVDVSDKSNPRVVDPGYTIWGQSVKGDSNTLYALNGNMLIFYNLGDPLAPIIDWAYPIQLDPGFQLFDYAVYDTLLILYYYCGSPGGTGGFKILDISSRDSVRVLSTVPVEVGISPMCLDYPLLYVPTDVNFYTIIFDISDPANPAAIDTLHNLTGGIFGVYTYENYVYVTGGGTRVYHWNQWNQIVFDRLLGFRPEFMVDEEGRIFYWGGRGGASGTGVQVWDAWRDPANPVFSGYHFDESSFAGRKIDVEWPYVYIPGGDKGLVVLRYFSPTGIDEEEGNLPDEYGISITAYPNPFNS